MRCWGLHTLLLAVILGGAGSAHAEEARPQQMDAIVWGSSADAESIREWLSQKWQLEAAHIGRIVTLAEGFPRLVMGGEVPGLEPGRAWLVLGYCLAGKKPPLLEWLIGLNPGASVRRVTLSSDQVACPVLRHKDVVSIKERAIRVGKRQLTVAHYFNLDETLAMDFIAMLREPSGAPAAEAQTITIQAEDDPIDCKARFKPFRSGITLTRHCPVDPSCLDPGLVIERHDFSVRGNSIVVKKRKDVLRTPRCDG